MHLLPWLTLIVGSLCCLSSQESNAPKPLRFRMQEIDKTLKVGYSVIIADVNNDKKPDIVVADAQRVIWFENPTWKQRTIIQGQTKPDNVSIAAYDIDGDGLIDFALAADWKPFNTKSGGTLQWLKRGKTLDEPWTVHPIAEDIPTIHRIRFADVLKRGSQQLIVAPLMGKGSSQARNWIEQPVELAAYEVPGSPTKERWIPTVLPYSLHVVHNFHTTDLHGIGQSDVLFASYEGVTCLTSVAGIWVSSRIGDGDQSQPDKNRGASEVRLGRLKDKQPIIATIEPWHGNQVVIYRSDETDQNKSWKRTVIDKDLKWGHALAWADLDGDGQDELIVGVRDSLSPKDQCGVRIYRMQPDGSWISERLDPGGVAVEDMVVADLNGDGKPDIIAVGRATGNVRIYWNER
ncbi:MAG TPA: VCBS repeat-containing protein [Gemmatales bacterium]|nr:VCBS repeat-containing protein [Gemmatales bacterium]